MAKLFKEEQDVLDKLLEEWYKELRAVTERADGIFREKARQYDKSSPVWDRIAWPHGFIQELRKKTDRIKQLLDGVGSIITNGEDVEEELIDIMNYARMLAALNAMHVRRTGEAISTAGVATRRTNVGGDDVGVGGAG